MNHLYGNQTIPYQVRLGPDVFSLEMLPHLTKMFTNWGNGMSSLIAKVPITCGGMPVVFPNLSMPVLSSVEFDLWNHPYKSNIEGQVPDYKKLNAGPMSIIYFMQAIFNGSPNLQRLGFYERDMHRFVYGFDFLQFPKTLSKLYLALPLSSSQLGMILKQDIQLSLFFIRVSEDTLGSYPGSKIFTEILSKFRKSLKTFNITGGHPLMGGDVNYTEFQLTFVMEQLEVFGMNMIGFSPKQGTKQIHKFLPKLQNLMLLQQTQTAYDNWTRESVYERVTGMAHHVIADKLWEAFPVGMTLPFTLERAQKLAEVFPNLRQLKLVIKGTETGGLRFIFENIQRLTHLEIELDESEGMTDVFWDSLVTGIPEEVVARVRGNRNIAWLRTFKKLPAIMDLNSN